MNKICAIIPAYNEAKNLPFLLKRIRGHNVDAIVVDDGSTDETAAVAEAGGACLLRHPSNEGKGRALRDGFGLALKKGYELVVTLDADGQHDTEAIPFFIKELKGGDMGIVIGNRLRNPDNMPRYRLFVNKLFSRITSFVCGQNIPDAACGYRIMKKEVLQSIALACDKFDIDTEIIIKSAKAGFKVGAINIKCIYAGEFSHIRPIQYSNDFFRLIIKELGNKRNG